MRMRMMVWNSLWMPVGGYCRRTSTKFEQFQRLILFCTAGHRQKQMNMYERASVEWSLKLIYRNDLCVAIDNTVVFHSAKCTVSTVVFLHTMSDSSTSTKCLKLDSYSFIPRTVCLYTLPTKLSTIQHIYSINSNNVVQIPYTSKGSLRTPSVLPHQIAWSVSHEVFWSQRRHSTMYR